MNFTRRSVRSKPGLTQEEALISLQEDSSFRPGVDELTSLRRRGSRWVAELRAPKTAGPPPAFAEEGGEEEPSDSGPPEEESNDGPPDSPSDSSSDSEGSDSGPPSDSGSEGPPGDGDGEKKGGGTDQQILHILTQILHALGGGGPEGMGGPDALGPGLDGPAGPPPAHKGPGHPPGAGAGAPPAAGGAGPAGRPLKPGEMRSAPGVTPVGAPSFGSTQRQATPVPGVPGAAPGGPPVGGPPSDQAATDRCPQCGYPGPCPLHGGSAINQAPGGGPMAPIAALQKELAPLLGKAPTLTISTSENQPISEVVKTVREAVEPHGYQIKQAKRVDGGIRVLASIR